MISPMKGRRISVRQHGIIVVMPLMCHGGVDSCVACFLSTLGSISATSSACCSLSRPGMRARGRSHPLNKSLLRWRPKTPGIWREVKGTVVTNKKFTRGKAVSGGCGFKSQNECVDIWMLVLFP